MNTAFFPPLRQCASRDVCASEGISCNTSSDCCEGLTCPTGGGLCIHEPDPLYETQAYPREYVSECPTGTVPKWRFFEWQATIPTGTSIEVYVQTKQNAPDIYQPPVSIRAATASTSTATNVWHRGSDTMDALLAGAGLASARYLLGTLVFNPNSSGTVVPTLARWRQIHDCVPGQ